MQIFSATLNLVTWQTSLVTLDNICPFPLVSSHLFAQSGTWSSRVSNSRGRRTRFTPGGLLYGRVLFKFSTTKNGRVITLEVSYDGQFTWLYGNIIFMMFRCSPS